MLEHSIIFFILFLYNLEASLVGNYSQLILIQHSPITSFFAPLQNQSTSADEIVEYLRGHFMIFNAQRWVVHGLWAIDSNAALLTKCETFTGTQPTYNHENMNDDLMDDLELIWPSLIPNGIIEEDLWEIEYNTYGSCVTTSEIIYFDLASRLMAFRNIGGILQRSGIVPGTSYPLNRIVTSITNFLRKRVYIICTPAQNNREQYLLGVELCFDRLSGLTDCYRSGSHYCDIDKTIMYPGRPRY